MELKSRDYLFSFTSRLYYSLADAIIEGSTILVPLWMAMLVGLLVGWILGVRSRSSPPVGRLWFPSTLFLLGLHVLRSCWLSFKAWRWPQSQPVQEIVANASLPNLALSPIKDEDLRLFHQKLHFKDGGPPWELLMQRSMAGMTYQAWRRDPQDGPTEYMSRNVFEDATPAIVKDFFWDDEFRHEWDDLIKSAKSLEGCTKTGAYITHWVKKFPFFCSDREYVIGRRIYESGGSFFCVTKAVSHPTVALKKSPRRVEVYSSSWCIQAVESPKTAQSTACAVTFVHSEDMGIQRDLAKLGVRQGMWKLVKKMEPGLRKYQSHRKLSRTLSHSASMAQVVTIVPTSFFESVGPHASEGAIVPRGREDMVKQQWCQWAVVGGVVAVALCWNRGVLGRVIVLSVSKRLRRRPAST